MSLDFGSAVIVIGLVSAGAVLGFATVAMASARVHDEAFQAGYLKCLKDHGLPTVALVSDEDEAELLAEWAEAGAHVEGTVR